ncbi:hypothetical protein GEV33_004039 [Tenebrio molitor]|uniref:RNA-directed DNA polymerase from mobile element jockey n=1 Tax=Tenebrio molitor TaxID=7067 RepID=A0A8J6LGS0_TENMO|nr:hypothetical protein GEV33_004039 [Tenebrio molitor]
MFGRDIPWKDQVKYLGVILDSPSSPTSNTWRHRRRWSTFITDMQKKQDVHQVRSGQVMDLNNTSLLVLFKSIIRPVMTYASVVWGHVSASQLNKLHTRRTACSDQHSTLPEFLFEIALRSFEKAKAHENPLVREAVDYDQRPAKNGHIGAIVPCPDILDIALAKNVTHQIRLTVIHELDSDHVPVLMHIGNETNDPDLISYGKTDWNKTPRPLATFQESSPRMTSSERSNGLRMGSRHQSTS